MPSLYTCTHMHIHTRTHTQLIPVQVLLLLLIGISAPVVSNNLHATYVMTILKPEQPLMTLKASVLVSDMLGIK